MSADFTTAYKKSKWIESSNYMPASFTSVYCKVLECHVFQKVMEHLDKHDAGFKKVWNCETYIEAVARAFDKNKQMYLTVFNLSEVFDRVVNQQPQLKVDHEEIHNMVHRGSCDSISCNGECEHRLSIIWYLTMKQNTEGYIRGTDRRCVSSYISVPKGTVWSLLCFLIIINNACIGDELSPHKS